MKTNTALHISILALCFGLTTKSLAQTSYESYIDQAFVAIEQDSLSKAENLFKQALRMSPTDYRNSLVHSNIGRLQERRGDTQHALDSYTQALNITPLAVPILKMRADLYLSLGNLSKACFDYGKIIDVDPNNTEALQYLGYIYTKQRDYAKAKTHYERLLSLDQDNYAGELGVVILFQECGKLADAMSRITLLIEKYPDRAELYSVRAEMESEAKQTELALMDLDHAIALDPQNANLVITRAYIYKESGNKARARKDFEHAIELGVPRAQLTQVLKECK